MILITLMAERERFHVISNEDQQHLGRNVRSLLDDISIQRFTLYHVDRMAKSFFLQFSFPFGMGVCNDKNRF